MVRFFLPGVSVTINVWQGIQFTERKALQPLWDMAYPLLFVQNLLTTGLLAWKIIKQHRHSKACGLNALGSNRSITSLGTVARIIVESASIYTFTIFFLTIAYFLRHPSQHVLRNATIPIAGQYTFSYGLRVELLKV